MKSELIKIFEYSKIKDDTPYELQIKNRKLFLIKINKKLHILSNYCLHKGAPRSCVRLQFILLSSKGKLFDETIECPWHGCKWNLVTGENNHNNMKLKKYDYKIINNFVCIYDF